MSQVQGGSSSYSTSETLTCDTWIDGKPIYRKVINMGAMPQSGFSYASLNITGTISTVTRLYGSMYNSSTSCPLPYSHPSNIIYNVQLMADNLDNSSARVEPFVK